MRKSTEIVRTGAFKALPYICDGTLFAKIFNR